MGAPMPAIDDEKMAVLLDVYETTRSQAARTIILDFARTEAGVEYHMIRDSISMAVLWKAPVVLEELSRNKAEEKLDELRRRRVIMAVLAAVSA